jgi:phage-related protein
LERTELSDPLTICQLRHILPTVTESDRPLVWLRGEIKSPPFSKEARIEAGLLLRRLQRGEMLAWPHSRPMPGITAGCHELRISDRSQTWRIIYFLDAEAVVILEVFSKKTAKTPKSVIENAQRRLKQYQKASST